VLFCSDDGIVVHCFQLGFCCSVTIWIFSGKERPVPSVVSLYSADCSVLSLLSCRQSPRFQTPAPTCLLSSINGVTHCLHAAVSHCVCGPEPAKQPYHLHFSIFIVDIYFCNYLSTSPLAEDDMLKLTLPLPSLSLLLLKHKHTDRRSNRQMQTDIKMNTVWWVVSSTV